VLEVAPAALLHGQIPQPDGHISYELVTGYPDRAPQDLLFLADLTVELRTWPQQVWTAADISARRRPAGHRGPLHPGQVKGLEFHGVSAEEARAGPGPQATVESAGAGSGPRRLSQSA
jgi:hypothetical protein